MSSNEGNEQKGEIQVIVAGLGRTGTMSMEVALRILGYKPYHMGAILVEKGHSELWRQRAEGTLETEKVFDAMTERGYNATMDSPMCDVYLDQVKLYPNAKVILTKHPKGTNGWAKSFINLMQVVKVQSRPFSLWYPNFFGWVPAIRDLNVIRNMIGVPTMGLKPGELCYGLWDKPNTQQWLTGLYDVHNDHVRKNVPSKQMLEFDVSQGWGPLCEFLGKPIPDEPFPHVNDSQTMKRALTIFQVMIYGWIPLTACGIVGATYGTRMAMRMWKRR